MRVRRWFGIGRKASGMGDWSEPKRRLNLGLELRRNRRLGEDLRAKNLDNAGILIRSGDGAAAWLG